MMHSRCCAPWCALNVYQGYNLVIRSLNGRQCCNKDERLSSGNCRCDGYELEIPEASRSQKAMERWRDVLSARRE